MLIQMKNPLRANAVVSLLLIVSACGSGGGSDYDGPPATFEAYADFEDAVDERGEPSESLGVLRLSSEGSGVSYFGVIHLDLPAVQEAWLVVEDDEGNDVAHLRFSILYAGTEPAQVFLLTGGFYEAALGSLEIDTLLGALGTNRGRIVFIDESGSYVETDVVRCRGKSCR